MYCFSTLEQFSKMRESVRQQLKRLLAADAEPMFVAINEAVNNAIFHGNDKDNTKKVFLSIISLEGEIKVIIRDEGYGFKPDIKNNTYGNLHESGRGLEIIGFCVDHYYFNSNPSEIVLIKRKAVSTLGVKADSSLKRSVS